MSLLGELESLPFSNHQINTTHVGNGDGGGVDDGSVDDGRSVEDGSVDNGRGVHDWRGVVHGRVVAHDGLGRHRRRVVVRQETGVGGGQHGAEGDDLKKTKNL